MSEIKIPFNKKPRCYRMNDMKAQGIFLTIIGLITITIGWMSFFTSTEITMTIGGVIFFTGGIMVFIWGYLFVKFSVM